jgi:hypothetical protein
LIPEGVEETVPLPTTVTESVAAAPGTKVAVTVELVLRVTVQPPLPLHAPLQAEKDEPAAAVAVRVTGVPAEKAWEHWPGQSIPAGVDVTVPLPLPAIETVRTGFAAEQLAPFTQPPLQKICDAWHTVI